MSEQKKGVHHAIKLSHYSVSKDEYFDIEDMVHTISAFQRIDYSV